MIWIKKLFGLLAILFGVGIFCWIGYNFLFHMTPEFKEHVPFDSTFLNMLYVLALGGLYFKFIMIGYGWKWLTEPADKQA